MGFYYFYRVRNSQEERSENDTLFVTFLTGVTKYLTRRNLGKEAFIWACNLRRNRIHHGGGGMVARAEGLIPPQSGSIKTMMTITQPSPCSVYLWQGFS